MNNNNTTVFTNNNNLGYYLAGLLVLFLKLHLSDFMNNKYDLNISKSLLDNSSFTDNS